MTHSAKRTQLLLGFVGCLVITALLGYGTWRLRALAFIELTPQTIHVEQLPEISVGDNLRVYAEDAWMGNPIGEKYAEGDEEAGASEGYRAIWYPIYRKGEGPGQLRGLLRRSIHTAKEARAFRKKGKVTGLLANRLPIKEPLPAVVVDRLTEEQQANILWITDESTPTHAFSLAAALTGLCGLISTFVLYCWFTSVPNKEELKATAQQFEKVSVEFQPDPTQLISSHVFSKAGFLQNNIILAAAFAILFAKFAMSMILMPDARFVSVTLGVGAAAAFLGLMVQRIRSIQVCDVYPDGVVIQRAKKASAIGWMDMPLLFRSEAGSKPSLFRTANVRMGKLVFDRSLTDCDKLMGQVQTFHAAAVVKNQPKTKGNVDYGPVSVTYEGLRIKPALGPRKFIPWDNFDKISMENGEMYFETCDKVAAPPKVSMDTIPNYLAMIHAIKSTQQQRQAEKVEAEAAAAGEEKAVSC